MKYIVLRRFNIFIIFFLFFNQLGFGQVPPDNLSGQELRTWLKVNYYDGQHITLGYSQARVKLYNYIDNENDTITCVYSGFKVRSIYGGTTTYPAPINCEHTIPQSFFGEDDPMVSDLHHLYPTYENWNSTRNNHPFAEIPDNTTAKWMYLTSSQTTIPTSNIDLYSEYYNSQFEPREDHKGNVARTIFYFYTMYPTQAGVLSQIGDINTFYQWNLTDTVDAKDIERNSQIETYQGDRNPYIDYPYIIQRAWSPSAPVINFTSNSTSIQLTWNNLNDETGYKIYRSTTSSDFNLLTDLVINSINYTDINVVSGQDYYYYVIAYNSIGNSVASNTVVGQLGSTTDVILSENNNKVNIYPNPASSFTTIGIEIAQSDYFDIQVYDLQGRVVIEEMNIHVNGYFEKRFDISKLNTGIYFIQILGNNLKETRKLIIQ